MRKHHRSRKEEDNKSGLERPNMCVQLMDPADFRRLDPEAMRTMMVPGTMLGCS